MAGKSELLVTDNCVDCAVKDCNVLIWHYSFPATDELIIEFQTDDVGFFSKQ